MPFLYHQLGVDGRAFMSKTLDGAHVEAVAAFEREFRDGKHARTAVGVNALPKNAAVEISCTFQAVPEEVQFTGRMNWIEQ